MKVLSYFITIIFFFNTGVKEVTECEFVLTFALTNMLNVIDITNSLKK